MRGRSRPTPTQTAFEPFLVWAVRIGILFVLLTPLIVTPSTIFPFVVGKALFARSVIEVTFALWLILAVFRADRRPPRSWILLTLTLWLLVSLLASITGVSLVRSLWSTYERMLGIIDLVHWAVFVLIAGSVFRSTSDWRLLFTINLALCAVVSLIGLSDYLGIKDVAWLEESSRVGSTLGNPTYLAAYTLISCLIGLGLILQSFEHRTLEQPGPELAPRGVRRTRSRRRRQTGEARTRAGGLLWLRAFWLLAVLLGFWALWLTGTRGAFVGLLAGGGAFAVAGLFWARIRPVRWVSLVILALASSAVVLFAIVRSTDALDPVVQSDYTLRRVFTSDLTDSSIRGRLAAADAGFEAALERPVLGWGPQNYLIAWGRHIDAEWDVRINFDQAHNRVVEEFTTTGAIGLFAYLLIWGVMGWAMLRSIKLRDGYEQLFVMVQVGVLVSYFVQNLFLFDTPATMMLFAVLLAFVVSEESWVRGQERDGLQPTSPGAAQRRAAEWDAKLGISQRLLSLPPHWRITLLAVPVSAVTIAVLLLFNIRPYMAAQEMLRATEMNVPWADRVLHVTRSIDGFPGLANYPRIYLAQETRHNISSMTGEEITQTMDLIGVEGARGLDVEPENWRLRYELGGVYQSAAREDPRYLAVARTHVDEAIALAPDHISIGRLKALQDRMEQAR